MRMRAECHRLFRGKPLPRGARGNLLRRSGAEPRNGTTREAKPGGEGDREGTRAVGRGRRQSGRDAGGRDGTRAVGTGRGRSGRDAGGRDGTRAVGTGRGRSGRDAGGRDGGRRDAGGRDGTRAVGTGRGRSGRDAGGRDGTRAVGTGRGRSGRRAVIRMQCADPITLTLDASHLDLSRAQRGRGFVAQASTTFCCCTPSPSTDSFMVSPTFRNTGSGLTPKPTPGGVPVAITSPACSVMKWLT